MNKASSVLMDHQKRGGEGRGGEESWECVFATFLLTGLKGKTQLPAAVCGILMWV